MQRSRVAYYAVLTAGFVVIVTIVTALGGGTNPRPLFLCALFALCSSPILYADALNGRCAILIAFLTLYFLFYGAADVIGLLVPLPLNEAIASQGLLSAAEFAVLLGALLVTFGYRVALVLGTHSTRQAVSVDWHGFTAVCIGLLLWTAGLAATWFWSTKVVDYFGMSATLGPYEAIGVLIARMVQPLGLALLAYRWIVSRGRSLLLLIVLILVVEFALGFILDSKELSIRGLMMVLLAKYLISGRVRAKWLAAAALAMVVSVPVFQAYRAEVLQARTQTREHAAQDLGENIQTALDSRQLTDGGFITGSRSFLARISLKPTMELIIARVGRDVPFQDGATLMMVAQGFIPRLLWPDKPDSAVGQLFNREFGVSENPDTFISATHLGELYWNLGWPGLVVGMLAIGFLLGFVNSRFALSESMSMTRFLVIATTIYLLCLRFEGGIALTYTVWIRSLLLIAVLHLLFARVSTIRESSSPARAETEPKQPVSPGAGHALPTASELAARMRPSRIGPTG